MIAPGIDCFTQLQNIMGAGGDAEAARLAPFLIDQN
jgi:hypothetical protein